MALAPNVFTQKIRKAGNSYVVTIPREEMERLNLSEGQLVGVQVFPVEIRPVLPPDLQRHFEESWQRNAPGYEYLAGR